MGVRSSMCVMRNPTLFSERTADSRPGPGPRTFTSRFFTPISAAALPAFSAATWAAKGVLLRDPRKPQPPAVAQLSVLPWRSVIVMIVLLKEACTCATASATCFFTFLRGAAGVAISLSLDPVGDALTRRSHSLLDCPPRALARACVRPRALSAQREAAPVTHAAIGAEVHQPLDAHPDLATQIALDRVLLDLGAQVRHLLLGEVLH